MALSRSELLRLARTGAEARLEQLRSEIESIYRSFPELRRGGRRPAPAAARATARVRAARSRRRAWSATARRAVSERMKKYWAARRAAEKKTGGKK
ncbi:MAG: hypothetical protein ACM3SQ_08195 [Betaproteobacteria bacterium]